MTTVVPPDTSEVHGRGGVGPGKPERRRRIPRRIVWLGVGLAIVTAGAASILVLARTPAEPAASRPSPSPAVLAPPNALRATTGAFVVHLLWDPPVESGVVDSYSVYRDGSFLASIDGAQADYRDATALPKQRYEYSIVAYYGEGAAEEVAVAVRTPGAPLAAARVDGTYDIKGTTTEKVGYSSYPDKVGFGWRLDPRCARGACGVRWNDLGRPRERITLTRHGTSYRGTGSSTRFAECNGVDNTSSVTLSLRVEKAEVVGDAWVATRLSGTLRHEEPVALGCGASHIALSLTARRV